MKVITCIFLCLIAYKTRAQEPKVGELAGRSFEMQLVKADDVSPVAWPNGHFEIKPISATITRTMNVYMLLQASGIAPDPGAFALVRAGSLPSEATWRASSSGIWRIISIYQK